MKNLLKLKFWIFDEEYRFPLEASVEVCCATALTQAKEVPSWQWIPELLTKFILLCYFLLNRMQTEKEVILYRRLKGKREWEQEGPQ